MLPAISFIRKVIFISLILGLIIYLLWPRTMIGPPSQVGSAVDLAYLQPPDYPQDSLLEGAWAKIQKQEYDKLDSALLVVPDSSLAWMKAQVYRSFIFLNKESAGQAAQLLEQQLPDSTWNWPLERNWFLAVARIQAGDLVGGYRLLDSVPKPLFQQVDSLKVRLIPFLPDSLQ